MLQFIKAIFCILLARRYEMQKKQIAFFDAKPYDRTYFDKLNNEGLYDIKYFESRLNVDTVGLAEGADAVCCFVNDQLNREVIDSLVEMDIHVAVLRCAGYNNVDLDAAWNRIHVLRVPAYSPHAVAEYALALMISLNRKTHRAYSRVRDNNFSISGLEGFDFNGKTAGIIGTGKIGRILIKILNGLGMNVLAFDAFPNQVAAKDENFKYVSLDQIYSEADIISLHCPLTPETKHIINEHSLSKMKKEVMIINTGRGGLIDTKALISSLKERRIGSAGLDVYEEESNWFFEDFSIAGVNDDVLARLLTFPNVLITSHQAFFTREALENISRTTFENLTAAFGGKALDNEICYQCGEKCVKKTQGRCFSIDSFEKT